MRARSVANAALLLALAGTARAQLDEPFPAVFELSSLLADGGGDGSLGVVLEGINLGDRAGFAAAGIGDLNGDGVDDVLIGAYRADPDGMQVAGEAYVVFGRADGVYPPELQLEDLDGSNGFEIEGLTVGDLLGVAVSSAGDINHDGFDDLAIGASLADPDDRQNAGSTYVIFGRDAAADPFPAQFDLATLDGSNGFRIDGDEAEDTAGVSVAHAGDVNGDGIDDLAIGAEYADPGGVYAAGSSYVVFGRDTARVGDFPAALPLAGLDGTNGLRMDGIGERDLSGGAVAGAGDVNGDGIDDVVVGARQADSAGQYNSGECYVVFGRPGGFPAAIDLASLDGENGFAILGRDDRDRCGVAVGSAGDINGDGFGDVLLGAYYADPDERAFAGEAYVVFGRDAFPQAIRLVGLNGSNGFRMPGAGFDDRNGYSVSALGDVNGDGRDDMIVGAAGASPDGLTYAGTSYVVYGRDDKSPFGEVLDLDSLDGESGFRLEGIAPSDRSGSEVARAGDFNNDGRPDLIVGAWFADPGDGRLTAGQTYVVFGRGGCAPDLDGDGDLDSDDFFTYLDAFASGELLVCDLDGDGDCDPDDFLAYLDLFALGC